MLIALDIDGTYTEDMFLWDEFIICAQEQGHDVIAPTMRFQGERPQCEFEAKLRKWKVQIIYTTRKAKQPYLETLGFKPDIWIDDNPSLIFSDSAV